MGCYIGSLLRLDKSTLSRIISLPFEHIFDVVFDIRRFNMAEPPVFQDDYFRTILDASPSMTFVMDYDLRVLYANREASKTLGIHRNCCSGVYAVTFYTVFITRNRPTDAEQRHFVQTA